MKVKSSEKLNDMLDELYDIDFFFVDDILSQHADFYTINDKSTGEDGVDGGLMLAKVSLKKKKPIYQVFSYRGNFSAYFVKDLSEVKKIFVEALKKACKENDN